MKKNVIVTICSSVLFACIIACFLFFHPYSFSLQASTTNEIDQLNHLNTSLQDLSKQVNALESTITSHDEMLNKINKHFTELDKRHEQLENVLVDYYIDRLKDQNYVSTYNKDYVFYTAAENLGLIGKPAIPKLIDKLSTKDDYERSLALYSLLLASQADNVKAFAGNDYIDVSLDFDSRNHPAEIKVAQDWWEKYKQYF